MLTTAQEEMDKFPAVLDWLSRVAARPAVKRASEKYKCANIAKTSSLVQLTRRTAKTRCAFSQKATQLIRNAMELSERPTSRETPYFADLSSLARTYVHAHTRKLVAQSAEQRGDCMSKIKYRRSARILAVARLSLYSSSPRSNTDLILIFILMVPTRRQGHCRPK